MKIIRYRNEQMEQLGILCRDEVNIIRIGDILGHENCRTMQQLIEQLTDRERELLQKAEADVHYRRTAVNQVCLLPPMERPVHDILCVGVNYRAHREEAEERLGAFTAPAKPVYFAKRAVRILGSGEKLKSRPDLDAELDYEAELAVIIGKRGVDIPVDKAGEYIFGYSVFNDFSSRALQRTHGQWFRGKSLDSHTAMGPVIVTEDELAFPVKTQIRSYVNGELRQDSNTELLIRDIPSLIADLSGGMTLEPGDIIATGTPAGVGMGFDPPRYLKKGDVVICEIEKIGKLVNLID